MFGNRKVFKAIFSLMPLVFLFPVNVDATIDVKSPEFKKEIQYCYAYATYWFTPDYLNKLNPHAVFDVSSKTKYEVWKCDPRPNDVFVVFTTIGDGKSKFVLSFTENPFHFSDGSFSLYPLSVGERFPYDQYKKVGSGIVDLSGDLYQFASQSDLIENNRLENIKVWLKKYLDHKKVSSKQHFLIIPNRKYFKRLDIYWPSEKKILSVNNNFNVSDRNPLVERVLEIPIEKMELSKQSKLNMDLEIEP